MAQDACQAAVLLVPVSIDRVVRLVFSQGPAAVLLVPVSIDHLVQQVFSQGQEAADLMVVAAEIYIHLYVRKLEVNKSFM